MRIKIAKRVDGARLYDEIVAAIPALAPVAGPDGSNEETPLVLLSDADTVYIDVPDGADEAKVRAAVASHNPDAAPAPQAPTPVEELNAGIQKASSLADIKSVFSEWSQKHKDYW